MTKIFKKGDKVICVNEYYNLVNGRIYTIHEIYKEFVKLEEIDDGYAKLFASRFKKYDNFIRKQKLIKLKNLNKNE